MGFLSDMAGWCRREGACMGLAEDMASAVDAMLSSDALWEAVETWGRLAESLPPFWKTWDGIFLMASMPVTMVAVMMAILRGFRGGRVALASSMAWMFLGGVVLGMGFTVAGLALTLSVWLAAAMVGEGVRVLAVRLAGGETKTDGAATPQVVTGSGCEVSDQRNHRH